MLRSLSKSDLNEILQIEESVHVAPWSEEIFNRCLEAGYMGWVVEKEDKIIGFIVVAQQGLECHILNICISQLFQHQGYGRKLLEHALKNAKESGVGIAYLEVRRSNDHAIDLYKKMRFQMIGEREGYYPTPSGQMEDALIFARDLFEDKQTLV